MRERGGGGGRRERGGERKERGCGRRGVGRRGRREEEGGRRERGGGRKKEGGISEPEALTRFVGGPKSRVFAGRPGKGLRTPDLGRFGCIWGPQAPTGPFGGPKSRVRRQARKRPQNNRFGASWRHFGAGGAHRPFWRSQITSLRAGQEKDIGTADLERFEGS